MGDQNNFINPEKNSDNKEELEKNNIAQEKKEFDFDIDKQKNKPQESIQEKKEFNFESVKKQKEAPKNLENRIDLLKKKLRKQKDKKKEIPLVKDELTQRIEELMETGIEDAYAELSPIEQQEFKIKGEETAWKIRQALKKTHVKIKEIFKLLFEWLKMLPGINKFFLEQEAKIKADKIFSLKKNK
jgi:hypothetical protein